MKKIVRNKIVIAVEGGNVTEKSYFSQYSNRGLTISFAPGNNTDIIGIYHNLCRHINKNDISKLHGDAIYLIVDIDNDESKLSQLSSIEKEANEKGIRIISSNACFEVWYLLHFEILLAHSTANNLIKRLARHIKDYDKSTNVFKILEPLRYIAIENAKKTYAKVNEENLFSSSSYTNVFEVVEFILNKTKSFSQDN